MLEVLTFCTTKIFPSAFYPEYAGSPFFQIVVHFHNGIQSLIEEESVIKECSRFVKKGLQS
jgi:hypothetical protein